MSSRHFSGGRPWGQLSRGEQRCIVTHGKAMRRRGVSYTSIARRFDVSYDALRRRLDPEFIETCRVKNGIDFGHGHTVRPDARPREAEIAARLAMIPADTRTPAQRLLGDPIRERSALGRREDRP